jgi:hypothetical protein
MDDTIRRNIDHFNELGARNFTTAPRPDVAGIGGNPQRIDSELPGKRNQEPEGTSCISITLVTRADGETYMSCILFNVRAGTITEIDFP